jgi:hypothetical protein
VLGRKREGLSRYTGAVCAIQGWVTGWLPALLLLTGTYAAVAVPLAVALAVLAVVVFGGLWVVMVRRSGEPGAPVAPDRRVPA